MADFEARDMIALKLTTDKEEVIWELPGSRLPRSTGKPIHEYLKDHYFHEEEVIRVVGSAINAELIKELFGYRVHERFASLEVCSPLCCETPEARDDPELTLFSMRKFNRPPSLGGWHEVDTRVFVSYALTAHYTSDKPSGKYTRQLVACHPSWPYISFIQDLDADCFSHLVGTIIDPRWYADPGPGSSDGDRLEQFLGLYPGIGKEATTSARSQRYQLVRSCWKRNRDQNLQVDSPRGFLWRIWASKGGGEKGDLAACKAFVTYLRLTWTMSLCIGPQAFQLFAPEHFFSNQDELAAYYVHLRQFHTSGE